MKDCSNDGLPMKPRIGRLLIFAVLLGLFGLGQQQDAFAQAGSTGGTIGKRDKSISGVDNTVDSQHAVPATKPSRSGDHSMATAPAGGPCGRILGTWLWYNDVSVTVHSDNRTTQSDGNIASVVCAEGVYTFTWHGFASSRMTLSPDGKRLSGTSPIGPTSAVRR